MSTPKLLSVSVLLLVLFAAVASGSHHHDVSTFGLFGGSGGKKECRGTIAECMGSGEEEFDLGEESSRRILAASRYISYGALRRDSVPCSRRGASYYNCRPGAQANPYSRGCSAITSERSRKSIRNKGMDIVDGV